MSSFLFTPSHENEEINFNIQTPSTPLLSSEIKKQTTSITSITSSSTRITSPSNINRNINYEESIIYSTYSPNNNNYNNNSNNSVCIHTPLNDILTTSTRISSSPQISSDEKRQNELEESERLAWRLMEEESMRAYEMQIEFMRNNPELFSQEELQAFNTLLHENNETDEYQQNNNGNNNSDDNEENDDNNDNEEDDEQDNSGAWTYDNLLEIARIVGGNTLFYS